MARHNLHHWHFGYNQRKQTLGLCIYQRRAIELSIWYVERNPLLEVQDTILHEIAHVLAGPRAKHNRVWRAHFLAIGGNGSNTMESSEALRQMRMQRAKYTSTCPDCGEVFQAHRRLKDFSRRMCGMRSCSIKNRNPETRKYLVWYEIKGADLVRVND